MTDAKHEAPAEGAGEIEGLKRRIKCLEKLAGEQSLRVMQQATRAKDAENELVALRARSSAPEAREGEPVGVVYSLKADLNTAELPDGTLLYTHPAHPSADHAELTRLAKAAGGEALGNLLAVIHGDGGHRAVEVGVAQAAVEAEKIVANLLSSAPEVREGEAVAWLMHQTNGVHSYACITPCADYYVEEGRFTKEPLYLHPAAPSADKLRAGLDEIERLVNQSGAIPKGELRSILAARKAEGA